MVNAPIHYFCFCSITGVNYYFYVSRWLTDSSGLNGIIRQLSIPEYLFLNLFDLICLMNVVGVCFCYLHAFLNFCAHLCIDVDIKLQLQCSQIFDKFINKSKRLVNQSMMSFCVVFDAFRKKNKRQKKKTLTKPKPNKSHDISTNGQQSWLADIQYQSQRMIGKRQWGNE